MFLITRARFIRLFLLALIAWWRPTTTHTARKTEEQLGWKALAQRPDLYFPTSGLLRLNPPTLVATLILARDLERTEPLVGRPILILSRAMMFLVL